MEQQQVAEEPVDDERDGRDEPARVVRRQRVPRVGRDRRRRDDREQLVDEGDAVAVERRARVDAVEPELGAPLPERDEEREQERAEQEPLRDADVDRDRARRRPQDEEPRDHEHVDELEGLEAERVGRLQGDERREAGERRRAERARERERRRARAPRRARRAARGESSPRAMGRERLTGWSRSDVDVADVVHEVRGARRRAVGDERRDGRDPARRVAELRGEDDAREEQEVLRPLPRPQGDERRGGRGAAARKLEDCRRLRHAPTLLRRGAGARQARRTGRTRRKRLPSPGVGLELDPAAERARELARDRQAEPGALRVARDERAEDALARPRVRCPGRCRRRRRGRCRSTTRARRRCVPPSGVHRKAFFRRFVITWSTRSPSVMIVGAVSDPCSS